VIATLPTPTARDGKDSPGMVALRDGKERIDQLPRVISALPTPRASANERRTQKHSPTHGVSHGATLAGTVNSLPTPTAQDAKASGAAGYSTASGRHSGTTLTDALAGAASTGRRGRVGPRFVEWMMGLPIGWTACDALETPSSRSKRRQRSRS
jgi:hypothetical protein